jgi:hypothetical protein
MLGQQDDDVDRVFRGDVVDLQLCQEQINERCGRVVSSSRFRKSSVWHI